MSKWKHRNTGQQNRSSNSYFFLRFMRFFAAKKFWSIHHTFHAMVSLSEKHR